jgi:hypothetical protein
LNKNDCVIAMLDVSKAFDFVGHYHLEKCLKTTEMPSLLRNLLISLIKNNYTHIRNKKDKSDKIWFRRGVFQGSPLSPLLFNLAINCILNSISEKEVSDYFGYNINKDMDSLSIAAFADDIVLFSNSERSMSELIKITKQQLSEIGLDINTNKSKIINIKKGKLV